MTQIRGVGNIFYFRAKLTLRLAPHLFSTLVSALLRVRACRWRPCGLASLRVSLPEMWVNVNRCVTQKQDNWDFGGGEGEIDRVRARFRGWGCGGYPLAHNACVRVWGCVCLRVCAPA